VRGASKETLVLI